MKKMELGLKLFISNYAILKILEENNYYFQSLQNDKNSLSFFINFSIFLNNNLRLFQAKSKSFNKNKLG